MTDVAALILPFDTTILAGSVAPSSKAMYQRDFAAYLAFAGTPEDALKSSTLARWRTQLANETQMSPNTINRMISAVKRLMHAAAEQDYIPHEAAMAFQRVRGVKPGAMKDRMRMRNRVRIEPETMRKLIDSIDRSTLVGKRNAALLMTLASSGLRIKELSLLKQQQIIKRGTGYLLHMYAEHGKNQQEDREANVSPEAVAAIREWLAARPFQSEYIFTSFAGRGDRPLEKPITSQGAWSTVKAITEAQGLEDIKPHDFRRFVGTQLAQQDLRKAFKALGHKRIETTTKYDLGDIEVGVTDNLF